MDYRNYAKSLLGKKRNLDAAYSSINAEVASLEQERCSLKTALGSSNSFERETIKRRIVDTLARIEDCRLRRSIVERQLSLISRGMNSLDDYQKDLLEVFFIDKTPSCEQDVAEKFARERAQLHRDKCRALEQFTLSVYGVLKL